MWSFRGNACDIPTDCPHRERGRLDRRLAAVRADRRVPLRRRRLLAEVAARRRRRPVARRHRRQHQPDARAARAGRARSPSSTARPAGATPRCIVPWELYRAYGDVAGPRRAVADDGALAGPRRADGPRAAAPRPGRRAGPSRRRTSGTCGTPASTGASGWSPGEEIDDFRAFVAADKGDVATAYFAHSARPDGPDRRGARPGRRRRPVRRAGRAASATAWQAEYLDADGPADARTPRPTTCGRWPSTWCPTSCAPAVADRLVELIRKAGHPPRHRLPGHAVPAAGARRHRPPRRRLRAAAPGQRAVVAGHGRPRRHDGVGALERRRRRRRAARVAQPLLQGRGRSRSCTATSPGIELVEPAYRRFRVRPRPGGGLTSRRGGARVAVRPDRVGLAARRRRVRSCASSSPPAPRPRSSCPTAPRHRRPRRAHLHARRTAMTAETTEWAGPARFLPPPEPTRRDDGVRHYVGAHLRGRLRLPAAAAGPVGAGRRDAGAAGRLDPRRRLDVRRPAVPARDAAAEPGVRRAARRRARRRDHRLPARAGGAVPGAAARRQGGRSGTCGRTPTSSASRPSGSASWGSRPVATSPRSSA